jgi:hypothetical protein
MHSNYLCSRNKAILILIKHLESFLEFLLRISILERRKEKLIILGIKVF